jgi:hypothetical protein
VLALKLATEDPGENVTLAGTETDGFALESATVIDAGVAWLRDKVQLAVLSLPRVEGAQTSDPRESGAESVTMKLCIVPL